MLKLTKESFTTFADKRINPYEMVIHGYLTIYNTQMVAKLSIFHI